METIRSIIHIKFCFTVRNKNRFNGVEDSTIYYILDLYSSNNGEQEGRIGLFNSSTCSVEKIAKFRNWYWPCQVATTQDQVNSYVRCFEELKFQVLAIGGSTFEIFDLNTGKISKGLLNKTMSDRFKEFTDPYPPECRNDASVIYFKGKFYYLGGTDRKTGKDTNRVDVRRSNENP